MKKEQWHNNFGLTSYIIMLWMLHKWTIFVPMILQPPYKCFATEEIICVLEIAPKIKITHSKVLQPKKHNSAG